ncbi:hypothetical protein [Neptunicella marina]|uniref:Nuclear transport factor 2 family protein n=1 Tax=Neptunicella marina TaxID=2125989 RepID=A0A8J6IW13_9ALTE|nr:hypothetical protein [Neptunicella marina]MBC3767179.1 hypothetical protein [Neptunicella marina]
MIKTRLFVILCIFNIFTSNSASALEKLTEATINKINDDLAHATSNCDFDQSTKYYYEQTKFFNYSIVDNVNTVQEQDYSEAISDFKAAMELCYISLAKDVPVSEAINISSSGQDATFIYEAFHYLKSTDGRFFESHNKGKTLFRLINGEVKIIETHYTGISFQELEKLP